ncbi:MAG: hypothetical protein ABFD86_23255 [Bryobacteraceae bacterium]
MRDGRNVPAVPNAAAETARYGVKKMSDGLGTDGLGREVGWTYGIT